MDKRTDISTYLKIRLYRFYIGVKNIEERFLKKSRHKKINIFYPYQLTYFRESTVNNKLALNWDSISRTQTIFLIQ